MILKDFDTRTCKNLAPKYFNAVKLYFFLLQYDSRNKKHLLILK